MNYNKQCQNCRNEFTSKRKDRTCCSNSCRCKLYKKLHLEKELERHRQYYWQEKKANYTNLRKINTRAKNKQRFGIVDSKMILNRDGNKCQNCGSEESLLIHHIDKNGRGNKYPNNDPKNLITLCKSCHAHHHLHNRKLKI